MSLTDQQLAEAEARAYAIRDEQTRAVRWAEYQRLVLEDYARYRSCASANRSDVWCWASVADTIAAAHKWGTEFADGDAFVRATLEFADSEGWPDTWRCFSRAMDQEQDR